MFTFRKINPAKNEVVAESYSKQVQTENMKKLYVNSQVTAFTTICESIGHFVIFLLAFITKSSEISSDITRIVFIMLHFNFLPYVFLMNTKENKSRVVQQGWVNLIRNLNCCANISLPCITNNDVVSFQHAKYNVKSEICIISQNQKLKPSTQCTSARLNTPTSECNPTSSKGIGKTIHCHRQINASSTSSLVSSDLQEQFLQNTREIVLCDLLSNLNDEKTYIGHFIRLSELESRHYNEDEASGLQICNQEVVLKIWKKLLSEGSLQTRVVIRQEILQKLQIHQYNNDKYKELLENYLMTEENFLEDEYKDKLF
jgi:hypothetical protein